eukprot:jgi/Bigna1/71630/fgenesh1_pg.16_\
MNKDTARSMVSLASVGVTCLCAYRYLSDAKRKLSTFRKEVLCRSYKAILGSKKNVKGTFQELAAKAARMNLEDFQTWICEIEPTSYPNGLRLGLSPEAVASLADELIARRQQVYDEVAMLAETPEKVTVENSLLRLSAIEARLGTASYYQHAAIEVVLRNSSISGGSDIDPLDTSVTVLKEVSPDKALRDISATAAERMSKFHIRQSMRKEFYTVSMALQEKVENKQVALRCAEERRLLEHTIRDQKRATELSTQYMQNLNEESTKLLFSEEELSGLPKANLTRLKKDSSGKFIVTLAYPDYFPVMEFVTNSSTRKRVCTAFKSRCKEQNTPLIEEMVKLRHEKATILGYPTHADYMLQVNMAKSPEIALDFLKKIGRRMNPLAEKELKEMLVLKKELEGNPPKTLPTLWPKEPARKEAGSIEDWDYRFYTRLREEREFKIDKNALKPYFPLDVVEKGMLEIYQEDAQAWHQDVRLFEVSDAKSGDFVGSFYLDLHPRPGKYGHACCMGLQAASGLSFNNDHKYPVQHPSAAMIANFTKPTETEKSCLTHDEVVTFFHEFGHVMHQICSNTKLVDFAGTRVERDFVEAPSQMLENWCWKKEAILKMSAKIDGKPIPDDLLEKLIKSRLANVGLFNQRQLTFGLFDLSIHSKPEANTEEEFRKFWKDLMGIDLIPGANPAASFAHLMGGYDARYYGYMWAEVFSADMFTSRFEKEGIMNPKVGMEYRSKIIGKGGTQDANILLKDFLGREPNEDAFLKQKGVE